GFAADTAHAAAHTEGVGLRPDEQQPAALVLQVALAREVGPGHGGPALAPQRPRAMLEPRLHRVLRRGARRTLGHVELDPGRRRAVGGKRGRRRRGSGERAGRGRDGRGGWRRSRDADRRRSVRRPSEPEGLRADALTADRDRALALDRVPERVVAEPPLAARGRELAAAQDPYGTNGRRIAARAV